MNWHITFILGAMALVVSGSAISTRAAVAGAYDDISEFRLPVPDPRIAVTYSPEDKSYLLGQMRLYLATSQRIVEAAAAGDRAQIAKLAAVPGIKHNMKDPSRPPGIRDRTPKEWDATAGELRKQFDELATRATTQPVSASLNQLSGIMQICAGCHQTYRMVE